MKLVVIGGVAAGMSAAARTRRLDEQAQIVVLERGQHVSFANCGLPYHVGGVIQDRDALLLQTPQSLRASLNLDVRTGHEVTAINRAAHTVSVVELGSGRRYEEPYDKLVLAPGARPLRPPLPGIDHPRVFALRNIEDMDRIKACVDDGARSAVVIGGGYIGVEMAENLKLRGLDVDLVEMVEQVMPPLDREMARDLESHLRSHGVRLHLGKSAAGFGEQGGRLRVELSGGTVLVADLAILSVGVKPDSDLARRAELEVGPRGGIRVNRRLQTSDPDIYAAGDAIEVRDAVTDEPSQIPLAGPANRQGRTAADNICGRASEYAATQGTAIVKVFDMTGGGTGASEKTLRRLGVAYRKCYVHPGDHAGYYPGSTPLHIKLLFAPETGKVLGAQVVGYEGVDKRLDVFATAIRAGMTVFDLENLELAYAPPYASAKDPVNMAAFVAANLLRGDLELWYPEEFPEATAGSLIVDVRTKDEYATWHIPGAVNQPLGQLRKSLAELPKDKPLLVYCKVGFRSYLAYRILRQSGFPSVRTLAGGSLTFRSWHGDAPEAPQAAAPKGGPAAAKPAAPAQRAAKTVSLDCSGLQCPGPIRKLNEQMETLAPGDEIVVSATDPGFPSDVPAWCRSRGHDLVEMKREGAQATARIRKGAPAPAAPAAPAAAERTKKTMVVFSGDLDKVLAAFIIANGAVSMGSEVTLFFTFWGLNALRRRGVSAGGKGLLDRMFGWMMPCGAEALKLSKLNMLGMGTAMMKHVMRSKRVDSLPELIAQARRGGVRLVACSMSMEVMGIRQEELVDGVEIGGVAAFLDESRAAGMTLFI